MVNNRSANQLDPELVDGIITPREILFSFLIIGVLVGLGTCVHGCIQEKITDSNLRIAQAIRISDNEQFRHCFETSPGDAICEGDLDAVDPVSDDKQKIEGVYYSIERAYQEYRRHEYYTTTTDKKGKTHRVKHVYWSWDTIGIPVRKKCSRIRFCGVVMPSSCIEIDYWSDSKIVSLGWHKRYAYSTIPVHHHGSAYVSFKDGGIASGAYLHAGVTPEELAEQLKTGEWPIYLFWFFAIVLIGFVVFWFCMLNNRWLESKGYKKIGINILG